MSGIVSNVFKNICEEVLQPAGVKVGGYPDEIFRNLSETKRDAYECRICYLIAKEAQKCRNGHLFCAACVYAWSLTSEDNVDRCPVCRVRGSYRCDASALADLAQEVVVCPQAGCEWCGKLADLRSHEHGLAVIGVDVLHAGLPFMRNSAGDPVFPDFGDGAAGFGATLEMERLRRRQRLARMQSHVLDGQTRLAFLMSLFEEDLERRRSNLAAIAGMQRRFHGEQFDQLMRLESELGEITASLLRLIEGTSNESQRFNRALQAAHALPAIGAPPLSSGATVDVTGTPQSRGPAMTAAVTVQDPVGRGATVISQRLTSPSRERLLQRESLVNCRDLSSSSQNGRVQSDARPRAGDTLLSVPADPRPFFDRPGLQNTVVGRQSVSSSPDMTVPAHSSGPSNLRGRGGGRVDNTLSTRRSGTLPEGFHAQSRPGGSLAVVHHVADTVPMSSGMSLDVLPEQRLAGSGSFNPHVITYPPNRLLVGSTSRPRFHAASSGSSIHPNQDVRRSLQTTPEHRLLDSAAARSQNACPLSPSIRGSPSQSSQAAQPNSINRSHHY